MASSSASRGTVPTDETGRDATAETIEDLSKTLEGLKSMPMEIDFHDDWRNTMCGMMIKPDVLTLTYGPGEGIPARKHELRSDLMEIDGIFAPAFHPGSPLLRNTYDSTSEYNGYRGQLSRGKHTKKKFGQELKERNCGLTDFAMYLRYFLSLRPLAADLPRWIEHWTKNRKPKGVWADHTEAEQQRSAYEELRIKFGSESQEPCKGACLC